MKLFTCQNCAQLLFFENTKCEKCEHRLGYLPEQETLSALIPEDAVWRTFNPSPTRYRFCANAKYDVCNWLISESAPEAFCAACRYNRTIPDTSVTDNRWRWQKIEFAKHRLIYTILKLQLPLVARDEEPQQGLAFDFLADPPIAGLHVLTGHDDGIITLSLAEADNVEREQRRLRLHEPYRTLLGHLRHEMGHYFWDRLVQDTEVLESFRARFGDERQDYDAALKTHYEQGPPSSWQTNFISAYASTHPWEDFAETWAHYLHIVDTLETAAAFGLSVEPADVCEGTLRAKVVFDPYTVIKIDDLIAMWLPLTYAVNSLNRSLGQPDLYPFILTPPAIQKLGFVNDLIHNAPRG